MSNLFLKTMAVGRIGVGAAGLLVPRHLGPLFGLAVAPEASIFARLFGSRDLVLGLYLWKTLREWEASREAARSLKHSDTAAAGTGISKFAASESQQQQQGVPLVAVRRDSVATAVWLGAACDAIDVLSGVASFLEGGISELALVELSGAALLLTAAGFWQMTVLRRQREEDSE